MKNRVDGWVFRCMKEHERSIFAHFVTLTYDHHALPINDYGAMTLRKTDLQDYFKRLRHLVNGRGTVDLKMKYYACGEYGTKNHRPHYHAIVFNVPCVDYFYDAWTLSGKPLGQIHVGNCTSNSVAYCMKYIEKSDRYKSMSYGREPEFALMSKGIGSNYVDNPEVVKWHKADLSRLYMIKDGHKIAMPRYYKDKIFDDDEKAVQSGLAIAANAEKESKLYEKFVSLYGDDYNGYQGLSFLEFKASRRMGSRNQFLHNFKSRSL